MDRYPASLKYLVVLLAFLHTLAGGHAYCCDHVHCSEYESGDMADALLTLRHSHHAHPGGHYDHAHHHATDEPLNSNCCCCQDDPCDHDHGCNGSGQQAISPPRSADDALEQLQAPISFFVCTVPVTPPSVSTGFYETVSVPSPALPLRLHLLYGLLLI